MKVSKTKFIGVLTVIYLLVQGYLELPFTSGAIDIPGAYIVMAFPLLAILNRSKYRKEDARFMLMLILLFAFSIFFVPYWKDILSRVRGFAQFTFSISVFVILYRSLIDLDRHILAKIFIGFSIILLVITALERFTPFSQLSDAFRHYFYTGAYRVYDGDTRDLNLAGYVRPKGFTSEPSLLGLGFGISATCGMMLLRAARKKLLMLIVVLCEWILAGTPLALIPLFVFGLDLLRHIYNLKPAYAILTICSSVALLLGVSSLLDLNRIEARFSGDRFAITGAAGDRTDESSERLRLVYPYVSAYDAVRTNPILGFGVGGKRSLEKYSSLTNDYAVAVGNNAFATIFIFFGLGGGLLLIIVFRRYVKSKHADVYLLFPAVLLLTNSMGGLETPRCWIYIGVLCGVAVVTSRTRDQSGQIARPARSSLWGTV